MTYEPSYGDKPPMPVWHIRGLRKPEWWDQMRQTVTRRAWGRSKHACGRPEERHVGSVQV
jgi:hypothetical protein